MISEEELYTLPVIKAICDRAASGDHISGYEITKVLRQIDDCVRRDGEPLFTAGDADRLFHVVKVNNFDASYILEILGWSVNLAEAHIQAANFAQAVTALQFGKKIVTRLMRDKKDVRAKILYERLAKMSEEARNRASEAVNPQPEEDLLARKAAERWSEIAQQEEELARAIH